MLLLKVQQNDLLREHLSKMSARFQDDSGSWGWLVHSLTTFPTGRPELIQAAELVAAKVDDSRSQFWPAIARYRAGKYEEADSLFSSAAEQSPLALTTSGWLHQPPIFQAFHAMIKARIGDREAARESLTKAKDAFQTAMINDHGTEQGNYGENWWDRLSAEALLAEAERVINGPKPSGGAPSREAGRARVWHHP